MVAKRHYDVVCGIVLNEGGQVLVSLRQAQKDQGGLWEFPGGKVEFGESLEDALVRELDEELGIAVEEAESWLQVEHEYPDYHITLYVWNVYRYQDEAVGQEGQLIRWVDFAELKNYKFPEANQAIVDELLECRRQHPASSSDC